MINANELRRGNKFQSFDGAMIQTVFEIIDNTDRGRIKQHGYEVLITPEENRNQYKPCEIEPIKLTEEWHNKFGCYKNGFISFEYKINERKKIIFSGDYIYLRDIQDMSNIESVGDDICVLWNNDIRRRCIYVHEWQNLYYALTGLELQTQVGGV